MNNIRTAALLTLLCASLVSARGMGQVNNGPNASASQINTVVDNRNPSAPVTSSNSSLRVVELHLCANGIEPSRLRSWTDKGDEQYREQLAMAGIYKGGPFNLFVAVCTDQATLEKCNMSALARGMRSEIHGPYQLFFFDTVVGSEMIKTSKETQDAIIAVFKALPLKPPHKR